MVLVHFDYYYYGPMVQYITHLYSNFFYMEYTNAKFWLRHCLYHIF